MAQFVCAFLLKKILAVFSTEIMDHFCIPKMRAFMNCKGMLIQSACLPETIDR